MNFWHASDKVAKNLSGPPCAKEAKAKDSLSYSNVLVYYDPSLPVIFHKL